MYFFFTLAFVCLCCVDLFFFFSLRMVSFLNCFSKIIFLLYGKILRGYVETILVSSCVVSRRMHLTNAAVQYGDERIRVPGSQSFTHEDWSRSMLEDYIQHHSRFQKSDIFQVETWPKICEIVRRVTRAWSKDIGGHRRRSFELLGFDIILDSELNPLLIEVNQGPSFVGEVSLFLWPGFLWEWGVLFRALRFFIPLHFICFFLPYLFWCS